MKGCSTFNHPPVIALFRGIGEIPPWVVKRAPSLVFPQHSDEDEPLRVRPPLDKPGVGKVLPALNGGVRTFVGRGAFPIVSGWASSRAGAKRRAPRSYEANGVRQAVLETPGVRFRQGELEGVRSPRRTAAQPPPAWPADPSP